MILIHVFLISIIPVQRASESFEYIFILVLCSDADEFSFSLYANYSGLSSSALLWLNED
jgi:hypothetical protein